jgi:predicted PhzF superfamily epimerase YddE/YHI9
MTDVHILRVFCGPDGFGGNPLGVVLHGAEVAGADARFAVARELGFSETVFVDDMSHGVLDIYTPTIRMAFAGHPLVGAGWLLRGERPGLDVLRPPVGSVPAYQDGDLSWIRARPEWSSERETQRYPTVADVDALPAPPPGTGWLYAWAWQDEASGRVRARGFPRRPNDTVEDEATGAAALLLTHRLGRALDIRQGAGSQIFTRLAPDNTIEVGGRVLLAGIRPL